MIISINSTDSQVLEDRIIAEREKKMMLGIGRLGGGVSTSSLANWAFKSYVQRL